MVRPQYATGLVANTKEIQIRNAYLDTLRPVNDASLKVDFPDLLNILKHQKQVVQNLSLLGQGRRSAQNKDTPEAKALAECEASLETIRSFLCQTLEFDPLKMQPSQVSGRAAQKVIAIPELAEMVMLYLTPYDVLQAMQSCRSLAAAIASPHMQVELGLRARDGHWSSPFDTRGPRSTKAQLRDFLSCYIQFESSADKKKMDAVLEAGIVTLHARFESETYGSRAARLPKIGERGQAMLICQPPVQMIRVELNCCRSVVLDEIINVNGITIGDLYHATLRYQDEHKLCVHARKSQHDRKTGFVFVKVKFGGSLQLRSDDPFIAREYALRAAREDSEEEESFPDQLRRMGKMLNATVADEKESADLDLYMEYKKKAHQQGLTILTLAEFLRRGRKSTKGSTKANPMVL
ncbi:hypothetical protein LTR17_002757 [Elasticomyces elasticus]|nr:hypothetical protein LTR17_002757 [Elasticomyces elasticus]